MTEQELRQTRENWREIPGYEGYYDVSDRGRIRSWWTGGGRRLSVPYMKQIQADKDGYPFVLLYRDGSVQGFRVSRLMLSAFVGPAKEGMEASHIDGNNANNQLKNLIWESRLANEQRKRQHGTQPKGTENPASKLSENQIDQIRRLRAAGAKLKELSTRFGVSESNISAICLRRIWTHV